MRPPRIRVRTLMLAVVVVAVLLGVAMMGVRAYEYSEYAAGHASRAAIWHAMAVGGGPQTKFDRECAVYNEQLARKYRRAAWCPWISVPPDPDSPCKGLQPFFINF